MDNLLSPASNLFPEDPSVDEDSIWFPNIPDGNRCDPLASPSWSEGSSCSLSSSPKEYSNPGNIETIDNDHYRFESGKFFYICNLKYFVRLELDILSVRLKMNVHTFI